MERTHVVRFESEAQPYIVHLINYKLPNPILHSNTFSIHTKQAPLSTVLTTKLVEKGTNMLQG